LYSVGNVSSKESTWADQGRVRKNNADRLRHVLAALVAGTNPARPAGPSHFNFCQTDSATMAVLAVVDAFNNKFDGLYPPLSLLY
jgi:hypothetical protein